MYFKLNSYAYLVLGEDGASIYDLRSGVIYSVPKELSKELWNLDSGKIKLESCLDTKFYEKLIRLNLAKTYKANVIIDKIRMGLPKYCDSYTRQKKRIHHLYLQIEDICNLGCSYCFPDKRNYKMTGCRQYNIGGNIDVILYKKAIYEAHALGCKALHLIGGEPFIQSEIIIELAEHAAAMGYSSVFVYTNGLLLTENILELLDPSAQFVIQIATENFTTLSKQLKKRFDLLLKHNKKYYFNICVSNDSYQNDKTIYEYVVTLNPVGIFKTFIYKNLESDGYKKHVSKAIHQDICKINENTFFHNIHHHPCLNGKITIFKDGRTGVCPMMPHLANLSLYELSLSEIVLSEDIESLWNRPISTRSTCEVCSLRFYCHDCIAINRSNDEKHIRAFCRKQLLSTTSAQI